MTARTNKKTHPSLAGSQVGQSPTRNKRKGTAAVSHVQIPASINEAIDCLSGLDSLLTAKEWERAAIVWAFTTDENKGGRGVTGNVSTSGQVSLSEFARLKIKGLRSREVIIRYRKAWAKAIEDGLAADVEPGRSADLPTASWHDYYIVPNTGWARASDDERDAFTEAAAEHGSSAKEAARIAKNHSALAAAIKADPRTAFAAANALGHADIEAKQAALNKLSADPEVTPPAPALPRPSETANLSEKYAAAQDQEEAARKNRGDLRVIAADAELHRAKRSIRAAMSEIEHVVLSDEDRAYLRDEIAKVVKLADLFTGHLDGDVTDWDAALASLVGGE